MKISKVLIPLLLVFSFISCSEEPITKGVITVYDMDGNTVSGATVVLSQEEITGVTSLINLSAFVLLVASQLLPCTLNFKQWVCKNMRTQKIQ